jgi:hypothetical protein
LKKKPFLKRVVVVSLVQTEKKRESRLVGRLDIHFMGYLSKLSMMTDKFQASEFKLSPFLDFPFCYTKFKIFK